MEALIFAASGLIVVFTVILVFLLRGKRNAASQQALGQLKDIQIIPPEGLEIPIRESFSGLKILGGVIGFSHNNLNPKLILFDDHIEYRVVLKGRRRYGDIEMIRPVRGRQLRFYFYGSPVTLSVWLNSADERLILVDFLRSRGVVVEEQGSL